MKCKHCDYDENKMGGRYLCRCELCGLILCGRCHPSLNGSYCPNCGGREQKTKRGWYLVPLKEAWL